jgi:hypothetical protein
MTPEERDYVQRAVHAIEDGDPDDRVTGFLRNALSEED